MLRRLSFLVTLSLIIALVACTPRPAPVTSTPAPQPAAAIPGLTTAPSLSQEDIAWAKVVEAAKKEGRLMVYTSTVLIGDTGLTITKAFKEKFGITLDLMVGRSPTIVERLRTEYRSNQVVADLADGAGARMMLLKEWGFTSSAKDLPVLKQKDVWKGDITLYDPDANLLVYTMSPMTVIINTSTIKPNEEPVSWFDLLEPKWKGKITTQDPVQGLQSYIWYVVMTRDKAIPTDYFDKFARQDLFFSMGGPADHVRDVARNIKPIGAPASATGAIPVIQEGAPIKLLTLKEGFPVSPIPVAFLKDSPHPNAAKVFMNWMFSPEGMKLFSETALTYSFRKDVPDAAPPNARMDWTKARFMALADEKEVDKVWTDQLMAKIFKK